MPDFKIPVTPQRLSQYREKHEMVLKAFEELWQELRLLEERLTPICVAEPEPPHNISEDRPLMSAVTGNMQDILNRLNDINVFVSRIKNRIDV